ncbi:hypothetical protein AQJ27_06555 [Streptomyces olivochromogenes]|nr:hypothetical protein AQJ27_06555 [Streptomyces olivochromogenes]
MVRRVEIHIVTDATISQCPHFFVVGFCGGSGTPQSSDSVWIQGIQCGRLVPEHILDVRDPDALVYRLGEVLCPSKPSPAARLEEYLWLCLLWAVRSGASVLHGEAECSQTLCHCACTSAEVVGRQQSSD